MMELSARVKVLPRKLVSSLSLATCLFLFFIPGARAQAAPTGLDQPDPSAALANPTARYLEFFHRWDTPLDDSATRAFSRVVRQATDFKAFTAVAPRGSEERRLFERHLAPFEEAAPLIRSGQMNEDLFFDAWYDTPSSWKRARPYVLGMREEAGDLQLYRGFEWLAQHADEFWARRESHPPHWQPIGYPVPTASDQAVYAAFNAIWSTPRDALAREFVSALKVRAKTFDDFSRIVTPGSEEYIKFDRVLCAYDQAGALVKNGLLHPRLFFDAWQSPTELWESAQPWVKGLRASGKSPHAYDNVDWLVSYESEWRGSSK